MLELLLPPSQPPTLPNMTQLVGYDNDTDNDDDDDDAGADLMLVGHGF